MNTYLRTMKTFLWFVCTIACITAAYAIMDLAVPVTSLSFWEFILVVATTHSLLFGAILCGIKTVKTFSE